ncbi:glycosyltransferase family 4 protein [Candidatus Bathyarchaeota archaeon]|nr:glycosyltransferase family 4 protein [Candidatus Bathyarchaeota archaeon]
MIITPNLQEASTGGLVWLDKFAEYASEVYDKTAIVDVRKQSAFIRNRKLLHIAYNTLFLLRKRLSFAFVDHNLNMLFSLPLLVSLFFKNSSYAVICFHVVHRLRQNAFRRQIEYLSEKLILKAARVIVVPSRNTYSDVRKFNIDRNKIAIIHPTCAVQSDTFFHRTSHNRILFVGNLEPRKGLDIAIRALSLLGHIAFSFDIIGGHHKQEKYFMCLKTLVDKLHLEGKVLFHGKIEAERIPTFYQRADIFVFPSLHEGYGMAIPEAMSFGLPIVATDVPPINEIVRDPANGFLFPPGDAPAMARALETLLLDPKLRRRIGRRNFEASKRFPTWDSVVRRTFQVLQPHLYNEHSV